MMNVVFFWKKSSYFKIKEFVWEKPCSLEVKVEAQATILKVFEAKKKKKKKERGGLTHTKKV